MKTKRVFVALPLPEQIKETVYHTVLQDRDELSFQKWVHPSDLHITLKFIGDMEVEKLAQLQSSLTNAVKNIDPFTLTIHRLGTFGSPASPSILWAGVEGDTAELLKLYESFESSLEPLRIEREKRAYHPHITLARRHVGKSKLNREILSRIADQPDLNNLSWQADHIVLYESQLGKKPMYHPIFEAQF